MDVQATTGRRIRKRLAWLLGILFFVGLAGYVTGPNPAPEEKARTEQERAAEAERRAWAERDAELNEAGERALRAGRAASLRQGRMDGAASLAAIPGIARAEWRNELLYVFTTARGTEEQFEELSLLICRRMASAGVKHFTVWILDARFAQLGETKTRANRYCR